jgi:branched-chain amino acid transport system substrate-binding protein
MSKRNWFVITSMLELTALAGVLLLAGCSKAKPEDKGAPAAGTAPAGATAPATDKAPASPGVTATSIKIGQTMPYSGPASSYGVIGKTEQGYVKMINDKGGINGRKIELLSYDDGYAPPKAVEQIRKLVESDGVAFIFNSLGTGPNTAIQPYLNEKKVPQLFVATGADKWADPKGHPWTMGWQPSYRVEAKIYAKYLLKERPTAKLCVVFQNDDFGKDYIAGLHDGLGDQYDKIVVKAESYEATDPTADSQIVTLKSAGCDALLTAAIPKFAAQIIRKVFDLGWKPLHFLSNVAVSRTAVLEPAGLDKSTGIITGLYLKDPADPTLADDPGLKEYKEFMKQYLPDLDPNDANSVYGYSVSQTLVKVLTQCGNDLSRENIMKQAASVSKLVVGLAVPGIEINTSQDNFHPFAQMQLGKFNGKSFERFGEVLSAN